MFIMFEIWIFFLQKNMDLLQEAFIHSPELCEARFIMDSRTLFNVLWTVVQKHPLTEEEPGQFFILLRLDSSERGKPYTSS